MILSTSGGTRRAAAADRGLRAPLVAITLAGSAAIFRSVLALPGAPLDRSFLLLVALTVACGLANFRMPCVRFTFSVSDSFTMTAAVLFGPAAGTALVA